MTTIRATTTTATTTPAIRGTRFNPDGDDPTNNDNNYNAVKLAGENGSIGYGSSNYLRQTGHNYRLCYVFWEAVFIWPPFSVVKTYTKKTLATAISLGVSICHQKFWQGHGRGRVVDPVKYFRSYSLITMQKSVTVSDTTCVQNTRPSTTHATIPIWWLRVKPYGRRYGGPRIWRKLGPRP